MNIVAYSIIKDEAQYHMGATSKGYLIPLGYSLDDSKIILEHIAQETEDETSNGFVNLSLDSWKITSAINNVALTNEYRKHSAYDSEMSLLASEIVALPYNKIQIWDCANGNVMTDIGIEHHILSDIQFQSRKLIFTASNFVTPPTYYIWDSAQPHKPPQQLYQHQQAICENDLSLPLCITYESFDGLKVPAYLYLPVCRRTKNYIPFVIYLHGGPKSQFVPEYITEFQLLLTNGYGVLAPNFRGSTGYGNQYVELDNTTHRFHVVKDITSAAQWLVSHGYTRKQEIALSGPSYGGYLTLLCISKEANLFGAACVTAPFTDLPRYIRWDHQDKLGHQNEYGSLNNEEFLKSISPYYHVDQIQTPVLIVHGDKDRNVPPEESARFVEAMRTAGKAVEYVVLPGEGHGFKKIENIRTYRKKMIEFFDRYLLPNNSSSPNNSPP